MLAELLVCLALNVYHEARDQPIVGQEAVAHVTLNRVRSPGFPDDVCAVVYQGGERRHGCQFSWYCDGRPDAPREREAWARANGVAARALLGLSEDPTEGALHYHAEYVDPGWASAMRRVIRIGNHTFYRRK